MWKNKHFFVALICKESCPIFRPKTISKGQDEGQRKAILSLYSQIPATGSYTRGGYCQKLSRSGSKIHRLWNGRRCRWPHIRKSEANTCLQKNSYLSKKGFEDSFTYHRRTIHFPGKWIGFERPFWLQARIGLARANCRIRLWRRNEGQRGNLHGVKSSRLYHLVHKRSIRYNYRGRVSCLKSEHTVT